MDIKVLGTGCARCKALEQNVRKALEDLNIEAEVNKVTDVNQIVDYGAMMTPGLMINGVLKVFGRVPNVEEIKKWISEEAK